MHSQWLDETNLTSCRTMFHYTIGLPTSLMFIRKKFLSAQTWFKVATPGHVYGNERSKQVEQLFPFFLIFFHQI